MMRMMQPALLSLRRLKRTVSYQLLQVARRASESASSGFNGSSMDRDADDLVHWIELYPAVGHWLAVTIGKRPRGVQQLDEAWEEWSLSTQWPLSADLILAGRDEDATQILRWLRGEPSVLPVQGESADEAVAFLHAAI